jgi:mRNA-degrading endonuclease RelE of RelBE toxin-antitoxin system
VTSFDIFGPVGPQSGKTAEEIAAFNRSSGATTWQSSQRTQRREHLKPSQYWKLRVGDYRAIYEIDEASKCVIVVYVGHRKNAYDEFSRLL